MNIFRRYNMNHFLVRKKLVNKIDNVSLEELHLVTYSLLGLHSQLVICNDLLELYYDQKFNE